MFRSGYQGLLACARGARGSSGLRSTVCSSSFSFSSSRSLVCLPGRDALFQPAVARPALRLPCARSFSSSAAEDGAEGSAEFTRELPPTLFALIESLPHPRHYSADETDKATWRFKNGQGMRFYRTSWRAPEPCYYTLTKFRPRNKGQRARAWGKLTWRGESSERVVRIRLPLRPEWRFIPESDWPPLDFPTLQYPDREMGSQYNLSSSSPSSYSSSESSDAAALAAEQAEEEYNPQFDSEDSDSDSDSDADESRSK
jgi:hypothetical protein